MLLLLRALARLLAFALLVVLALGGLAVAIFCIQGGHSGVSIPALARDLHLSTLRMDVGRLLARLQAPGPIALVSALSGAGAMLAGLLLLLGVLAPRRERLVVLERSESGQLAARRRALATTAERLTAEADSIVSARARARPRRRRAGARVTVAARPLEGVASSEAEEQGRAALAPLTEAYALATRVRARRPVSSQRDA